MSDASLNQAGQERLEAILAEYLQQSEAGQAPDRRQLLDRHPDLADPLEAFFSNFDHLRGLPSLFGPAGTPAPPKAETVDDYAHAKHSPDAEMPWPRRFGDYDLLAEVARGGMGVVYKARQTGVDRVVALKMIRDQELATAEEVQRFFLEAEAAAGLEHPHIVRIHQIDTHEGQHFFTMPMVEGGSLSQALAACQLEDSDCRRRRPFQRTVAGLLARVARAVHHAHQHGVLHRDIKPGNVLLEHANAPGTPALTNLKTATPVVTDFGLAKKVAKDPGLTQPGAVVGTPAYIAPEQAQAAPPTTAADIYGLGAVLYEALTGSPPFHGPTALDTLLLVTRAPLKRPRALNSHIDRDLETICLKCLQKDPVKRYATAENLAEDLERWQAQQPIRARRAGPVHRTVKWARRHTVMAALLVLLALTPLTGYAYSSYRDMSIERERIAQKEAREKKVQEYGVNIQEALKALEADDKARARKYLDAANLPEARGWEWHLLDSLCQAGPSSMALRPKTQPFMIKPPLIQPPGRFQQANFSKDGKRLAALYAQPPRVVVWDTVTGEVVEMFRGGERGVFGGYDDVVLSPDGRHLALAIPDLFRTVHVQTNVQLVLDPLGQIWSSGLPRSLTPRVYQPSIRPAMYNPLSQFTKGIGNPLSPRGVGVGGIRIIDPFGTSYDPFSPYLNRSGPRYLNPVYPGGLSAPGLGGYSNIGGLNGYARNLGIPGMPYTPYGPMGYGSPSSIDGILRALDPPIIGLPYVSSGLDRLILGGSPGFGSPYRAIVPTTVPRRQKVSGLLGIFDLVANRDPVKVTEGMNHVAFSSDGSLIGASVGEAVSVRKAATGEVAHTLGRHPGTVRALAFSGDGRILATGGENGTVRLWDIATGLDVANFTVAAGEEAADKTSVTRLAFSPDGKRLVVKTQAGAVMVWDVPGEREAFAFPTECRDVVFSPDSERLVLARADGTVAIVRAQSGEEVCAIPRFKGEVQSLTFRPDGALAVAVASESELSVHVWKGAP